MNMTFSLVQLVDHLMANIGAKKHDL